MLILWSDRQFYWVNICLFECNIFNVQIHNIINNFLTAVLNTYAIISIFFFGYIGYTPSIVILCSHRHFIESIFVYLWTIFKVFRHIKALFFDSWLTKQLIAGCFNNIVIILVAKISPKESLWKKGKQLTHWIGFY